MNILKTTLAKRILSIFKKICLTLLGIFLFLRAFSMLQFYIVFGGEPSPFPNQELSMLVNSVLGVAYFELDYLKNDTNERVKFSEKEWMSLKCKPKPRLLDPNTYNVFSNGKANKLPLEEKAHLSCIEVGSTSSYRPKGHKSIYGELCNGVFSCEILHISIGEYVLQYPEIMWNIIKIAERPCDYIKSEEEMPDGSIGSARNMRGSFSCEKSMFSSTLKFVVISVERGGYRHYGVSYRSQDIIVRRQDVD